MAKIDKNGKIKWRKIHKNREKGKQSTTNGQIKWQK